MTREIGAGTMFCDLLVYSLDDIKNIFDRANHPSLPTFSLVRGTVLSLSQPAFLMQRNHPNQYVVFCSIKAHFSSNAYSRSPTCTEASITADERDEHACLVKFLFMCLSVTGGRSTRRRLYLAPKQYEEQNQSLSLSILQPLKIQAPEGPFDTRFLYPAPQRSAADGSSARRSRGAAEFSSASCHDELP
ncbi:hypothetical protein F2P81_005293 [Scophthalmus maximus]|uniref:Uncharacterized protein n=1 Tax=Scophthalmus maximus TaxID=52904 RepID=A0A6A4TFX3_SCOMX|nr:hypothetical protein F2P81_005293 [Scophthalmus maximus]